MKLPSNYADRQICMIGLGYVGLTLAVAMAEVGFRVYGVEKDKTIVDCINKGQAHFTEAGLDLRLAAQVAAGRLTASVDWPAKGACNIFVITVGTPLNSERLTNLDAISAVAAQVAKVMEGGALVVLRSTVRLGVTREVVKPLLDAAAIPYDLAFCPERTLEGKALMELRTLPQIVGGWDEESAMRASQMFNFITPTTIRVKDLETAEMIKLVNNTQRDLMFAFANEVAGMCDAVGVSVVDVISAGNMGYSRASMPIPGPVGGPCLEKDPYILSEGVRLRGGKTRLTLMGRQLNEELPALAVKKVAEVFSGAAVRKIAVAGLAFKGRPETSDLRGSLVTPLIAALRAAFPDAAIVGFDPAVNETDTLGLGIAYAETAEIAFQTADVVLFQNNNTRFAALDMKGLSQLMNAPGIIYDFWNQFDLETLSLATGIAYFGLGTQVLLGQSS